MLVCSSCLALLKTFYQCCYWTIRFAYFLNWNMFFFFHFRKVIQLVFLRLFIISSSLSIISINLHLLCFRFSEGSCLFTWISTEVKRRIRMCGTQGCIESSTVTVAKILPHATASVTRQKFNNFIINCKRIKSNDPICGRTRQISVEMDKFRQYEKHDWYYDRGKYEYYCVTSPYWCH